MEKKQNLAIKLALVTVILWSTVATAFKLALTSATPMHVVIVSSFTSLFVLIALYVYGNTDKSTSLLSHFRHTPFRYIIAGNLNPVLYYWVLFAAYDQLPAQMAQSINYTWAIVLSILAVPILKQRFSKADMFGLVLCYLGVFVVVTKLDFSSLQNINIEGVLLALLSTLVWASYWLLNTKMSAPPITSLLLCFLCATPSLFILLLINLSSFQFSLTSFMASLYIGLFEMSLAFVLWLMAMKRADSTAQISMMIYISPFLSLVFIYFILEEPIYPSTLAGLSIICLGLIAQKHFTRIRNKKMKNA